MKCSVVLATYNGSRFINEQLSSLLRQERAPCELIASDDASHDNTLAILREFAQNAPFPVHIIQRTERLGYALNFASAASHATGDLIAFCDQDDIWNPRKIAVTCKHFEEHPSSICAIHDISIIDSDGIGILPSYFDYLDSAGYASDRFVKGCATTITRRFAEAAFPPDRQPKASHDAWIHSIAQMACLETVIREPLVAHRIHDSNASGYLMPKRGFAGRYLPSMDRKVFAKMTSLARGLTRLGYCPNEEMHRAVEVSDMFSESTALDQAETADVIRRIHRLQQIRSARSESAAMQSVLLFSRAWKAGLYRHTGGSLMFFADLLRSVVR